MELHVVAKLLQSLLALRAADDFADAGHQEQQAIPAHFVARILEHAQERQHVLHVRGLEELEPAPLVEGDVAGGELDLQVGAHIAGAEEHGHLAQRDALLVQLEDAVHDEARLLLLVLRLWYLSRQDLPTMLLLVQYINPLGMLGALFITLSWTIPAIILVVRLLGGILLIIVGIQYLLNRTKLGLAIRAVAQDEETARTMGVNFTAIVLVTFAIGSGLAAFAGVMNGLYYNEINFGIGLYLGVVGFSAAIIGGLGSIYGAILGGFLFAGLQTIGTVLLPFASAYKDVFAFAVVIAIMAWRPTGLIREKISERV